MDSGKPKSLLLLANRGHVMTIKTFARGTFAALLALLLMPALAEAATLHCSAVDPPRNARFPAHNQQLLIPSNGVGLNALLFVASGLAPHPTVILMHGLPGNERNLDLAQAIRRCGWDVLAFTYRGAWGSPGDFSIQHAMEDTAAALEFARSPEAAKLGIDPRHIVLAGHSMGGATATMAAASASGLDGLILIDAWNIAGATSRGATARDALARAFDDFGNSLHGASPESVADEVIAKRAQWDLVTIAPKLIAVPVLMVSARAGLASEDRAVRDALIAHGNRRVTAVELDTDHSFSDHRLKLAEIVGDWLSRLRRAH
jgi:pimeloyl-ACP methyl ester carboxylesterase